MSAPTPGKLLDSLRLLDGLRSVASVAFSSAMRIGVALLLILVLLPAALAAIRAAAP